jgi:MFS family permease
MSIAVALGFGMVIPVLPLYAKSFGVGLAAVGLIQLVFGLTRFSSQIFGGLVVDRFGERATTIAGLLIVSASSFWAGLATSFPELVIARGVGGFGSALFMNGLNSRILRIIAPEAMGRATGASRSTFLIGTAIGPAAGGLVAHYFGLSAPFTFYGGALLIAAFIGWFVLGGGPERGPVLRRSPLAAVKAARPLFSDIRYVTALLATLAGWWAISGPVQIVGVVYARDVLNLPEQQIGLAITLLAVGEIATLTFAGRAADRYGRRAVLVPSLTVMAVAVALLGEVDGAWGFYVTMAAIGAGTAASSAAAGGLLGDSIPKTGSGAAVGVNQMAGDLGYLTAPIAVGALADATSYSTAYAAAAVVPAAVLIAALRLRKRPHEPAPDELPIDDAAPMPRA